MDTRSSAVPGYRHVIVGVSDLHVQTEPDGALAVSWAAIGGPVAVDVAVGTSPEGVDHEHVVSVEASATSVRLEGLPEGRLFVSVAPHDGGSAAIAADRRVAFRGLTNFRDLGGYLVRGGGRTRWGRLFRAESLHSLSGEDLAVYRGLGVTTVYDLRRDVEREERPSPIASVALSFLGDDSGDDAAVRSSALASEADGGQILHAVYVRMLEGAASQIGVLFAGLADEARLPAVFHCHAGKDRTGLAAALVLEALGVGREQVLDDYELTSHYRQRSEQDGSFERLVAAGIHPAAAAGVLGTPRWAMAQALDELDRRYGGVEPYLLTRAGVDQAQLDALRANLSTS